MKYSDSTATSMVCDLLCESNKVTECEHPKGGSKEIGIFKSLEALVGGLGDSGSLIDKINGLILPNFDTWVVKDGQ